MPGKAPRQKGDRLERLAVQILTLAGLDAKRVPLSGSMRGFRGDVMVGLKEVTHVYECKSRRSGFKLIYEAFRAANDALILKIDREEPVICVPLRAFAALLAKAEGVTPLDRLQLDNPLQGIDSQSQKAIDKAAFIQAICHDKPLMSVSENLTSDEVVSEHSPLDVSRETQGKPDMSGKA